MRFSIIIISTYEGIKIYIIEIYICAYNQTHIKLKIRKKLEIFTEIFEKILIKLSKICFQRKDKQRAK